MVDTAQLKDLIVAGVSRFVGKVFLSADPTADLEAATKHYVDQKSEDDAATIDATYVKRSGDTMTGMLTLKADPTSNLQAATKQYADKKLASFSVGSGTLTIAPGS